MKQLQVLLSKKSGRNNKGRITVRHQGGRPKRFLREIDFKPNRNTNISLLIYEDGEKRYILTPVGLEEGKRIIASETAPIEPGNSLPLAKIPAGTQVHNIEIKPGKGGQIVKSAGTSATVQGKEQEYILIKLPSGEIKRFKPGSWATIGQVGNLEFRSRILGKAGRKRNM